MAAPHILTAALLIEGLRQDFTDTYTKIRNRQSDSRLAKVMDLNVKATNRTHTFGYIEAAPHVTLWRRGDPIPQDAMGSTSFTAVIHEWGRRINWSRWDREDDQTGTLFDAAKMTGESAGLLPERFFFDLLQGTTSTLPYVPTAPDGSAFFATTAGGVARFGATNGNLLTGTGVASATTILADYYSAITQFMLFQDGKGQPMLSPEAIASGVIIIHAAADTAVFEQAFLQTRRGVVYGSNTAAAAVSNIVQEASRNVELWASPRLATGDWYVFLLNPPKQPTFLLERSPLQEFTSMASDNNSDLTRDTAQEYIQWDIREGSGIALPYGAIKVNN